ncbi:MAG TPA: diaminopropionate ammonia-lyase [Lachnospiraceae bacterium]|jgi:diaminopropionate ammonia-lyase|nr:diaminopropionate ammonia-lyase [Lachnospiraceae bacterium]HBY71805.1 diaminopropionate ammonia-lyase [Lachnospiraceae bacterium]HCM12608.1 diaminopropionate ammonia-lyase [Lachnospiraceae bacterium]HCR40579.1 diaminopropionate ammonia-lyase [Lachnospiraceae bacterium]
MEESFKAVHYDRKVSNLYPVKRFGYENAKKVIAYHKSFPEYSITPLANESKLAASLGLKNIFVKDESYRFGLNAFKVLGGSYAIGSYIAKRLNMDISELPYEKITSREIRDKLGDLTFVTATDGNHGRGVAWTANRLNQKSVVYMPKGSAKERLDNIRTLGSDASITELNYDDAVRLANAGAEKYGWVMVQDTAWEGYEDIPAWIMEGYTTMAYEAVAQLKERNIDKPTHIFLQAGVGALSGGLTGFFADLYGDSGNHPIITIVEPNKADCIYRTAKAKDGKLHFVSGDMNTIMAGLACGEPCTIGWNVLCDHADNFVSMPDYVAAKGMRVLGNPLSGDDKVVSGESGAATLGLVAEAMQNPSLDWLREQLKLDENSTVLCFSTEGDTDRANYRRIVWDGQNPSY